MCRSIYRTNSFNFLKPLPNGILIFPPIASQGEFFKKNKHQLHQDNFRGSMCLCLWDAGAGENLKLPIFIGYSAVPNMNF